MTFMAHPWASSSSTSRSRAVSPSRVSCGEAALANGSPAFADERAADRQRHDGSAQRDRVGAGERLDFEGKRKAPGAQRRLQLLAFGCLGAELRDRHSQLAASSAVDADARPRRALDELARQAQLDRQREKIESALGAHDDGRCRSPPPAPADARLTDQRPAVVRAIGAVLDSFETRTEFLEDVAVADTVLVLQVLAAQRDMAVDLPASPRLP